MPAQITRYRHGRMTGREFKEELAEQDMSFHEFARLTGTRARTIGRWADAPDADHADAPPYWVTLVLYLTREPAIRSKAHGLARVHLEEC